MPSAPFPAPLRGAASRALLRWYDRTRRDLPWRREASAYRTLVSELMLEQTVVVSVVPYFERFMRRFPDFAALAAASEDDVIASWAGLGYYARARHLHRTARIVVAEHEGALPPDESALRRLPGVGEYTAAAIAAIAFGACTFALDGNAARVMARLTGETRSIDEPATRTLLRARGLALVPAARPGDFAQAVMELGARVCVSGVPRCADCPLARWCRARAQGLAHALPIRTPRVAKRVVALACVAVRRRDRLLLVRRPAGTLLGGTWTLPAAETTAGESDARAARRALRTVGLSPAGRAQNRGSVRHIFTHRDVTVRVLGVTALGTIRRTAGARWVSPRQLQGLALSSFTRKTLALLVPADQGTGRISSPSTA